jgi:hypothetical protein
MECFMWLNSNAGAITAITAVLGLLSLGLIFWQIRSTRIWKKLHFTYTFFPSPAEFEDLEVFLDERIMFWRRDNPLTGLQVKALIGKDRLLDKEKGELAETFGPRADKENVEQELYEAGRKLKLYMNQIETYCAAISSGIIDADSAKNVYSYKFRRAYEKALPWIKEMRSIKNEPGLYIEIKKALDIWYPNLKGQEKKY